MDVTAKDPEDSGVMAMVGNSARSSSRGAWLTGGYVLVAIAFCFVPEVGIEWFAAPRAQVVIGGILAVLVLGGLHLLRVRWPATVVVGGVAVMIAEAVTTGTTSVGAILIECDALYGLVIARSTVRSQRLIPVIAAVCLSLAVAGLLLANVLSAPMVQTTILLLAAGVTLWWGITVRIPMDRAHAERERAALVAEAEDAKHREALVAERLQISRELHDAISGHLSAIAMQSAAAAVSSESPVSPQTEKMARIRALSLDAMADMRTLIDVLRSDPPTPVALPQKWSDIETLIDRMRESGSALTVTGDDPSTIRLAPIVSVAAYNVVREALVNAAKHAPDSPVAVDIRGDDDLLAITIENGRPPPGRSGAASAGYGLSGLAERVRLCGGRLDIDASDARWILRAVLPQTSRGDVHHAPHHHRR